MAVSIYHNPRCSKSRQALQLLRDHGTEPAIIEYLKDEVRPGQRVVVSELVNEVFTSEEERAVLGRLFNTFFKIPLFAAQFQESQGRPPTLDELSEQFGFAVPGEADVMLRSVEASAAGRDYPQGRVLQAPRNAFWRDMPEYKPHLDEFSGRPQSSKTQKKSRATKR